MYIDLDLSEISIFLWRKHFILSFKKKNKSFIFLDG